MKDALHPQLWRRPEPFGSLHCQIILVLSLFGDCGEVSIVVDVAFRLEPEAEKKRKKVIGVKVGDWVGDWVFEMAI
jgi:hypothetical protein